MNRYFITLEASAVFSLSAPTIQVLLDGVVVGSSSVTAHTGVGRDILSFSLSIRNVNKSSVTFRFNDSYDEPGRSVSIEGFRINGQAVDVSTKLTTTHLAQSQSASLLLQNLAPTAQTDDFAAMRDQVITGNVLANNGHGADSDPEGDALHVKAATITTVHGGHVVLSADGSFTYTPAAGYAGADSFAYRVLDSHNKGATGTVNIVLSDYAPLAKADDFSLMRGQVSTGNVLADNGHGVDSDPDGGVLSVQAGTFATVEGGSIVIAADGTFTYTHAAGFAGVDSATYTLLDGQGGASVGTITFNVNNNLPVAHDDRLTGSYNQPITGNVLSDNGHGADSDPDGGVLAVQPADFVTSHGGHVVLNGDGSFTYTPANNYSGADSFAYTLLDGQGGSAAGTVNLGIDPAPLVSNGWVDIISLNNPLNDTGNRDHRIPEDDFIYGTANADVLIGTPIWDVILGMGGDDIIFGNGTGDNIDGGLGNDQIWGGDGDDEIVGDAGNDTIYGENDDDIIAGEAGNDTLDGGAGSDMIDGGAGADTISGGTGIDLIAGNAGNDIIAGGDGNDMIDGGGNNDTINGDAGDDRIMGGTGDDTLHGGDDNDYILGDAGNDTITGDNGNDALLGGAGIDNLDGGAGTDKLYGHTVSNTTASTLVVADPNLYFDISSNSFYKFIAGPVNYAAAQAAAAATTLSGVSGHLAVITSSVENAFLQTIITGGVTVWLGGSDSGTEGSWVWSGGVENGFQFSQASTGVNNFFTYWAGAEPANATGNEDYTAMNGGTGLWSAAAGTATYGYVIEWDGASFADDNLVDTLTGGTGDDILQGGGGADILSGDDNNDQIWGGAGNDTITGGNNDDMISGDDGDDTITGGTGIDYMYGGNNNDTFNLANGDFSAGETITGGAGTDVAVLTNATTVDFTTGTLATLETLTGSAGVDTVTLLATQWVMFTNNDLAGGADTETVVASGTMDISTSGTPTISNLEDGYLTGSGGSDTLTITGAQIDAIIVGVGTINMGAGAADTINITTTSADLNTLGATDASIQGLEVISASTAAAGVTITLSGQTEGFTVTGSANNDTITGGSGADTISAGAGADTVSAGNGNNTITGGTGADTITAGTGTDTINLANGDFAATESIDAGTGSDSIVLTNATTVDFTTGTLAGIETMTGSGSNDSVTMAAASVAGMFTAVDLGAGAADVLNTVANSDITAASVATITNTETGNLTGTAASDTFTASGAQIDSLIIGTGTIDMGGGAADTFNITSTSADLNTLGATDASIQGLEIISAATAGAGVTITLSGQTEGFTVTGSANADTITGGSGADTISAGNGNNTITGGGGVDTITAGTGTDTINLANGDFGAGESIDGGTGSDTITLTSASTTVDFTTGTLAGIETLTGNTGNDIVTVYVNQAITAATGGMFNTIGLAGGTDDLYFRVSGTMNISAGTLATLNNIENGYIAGSGGDDVFTVTATQFNALIIGSGTLDMGAGTGDTINLNGTASDLNTLGAASDAGVAGVEIISFSGVGSNVTLDLSLQTEGFTVTGGTAIDTITLGDGDDTVTANAGADVLVLGEGNNTVNLANGDFASGESITGGGGTDTIVLTNATTINFTTGTLTDVDDITGSTGNDTVTMLISDAVGVYENIDLAGGTDILNMNVSGTVDVSAAIAAVITNLETSNIVGSGGVDALTITGTQLDDILVGSSGNTINMGAGADVMNLTSTSAVLNTLGGTDSAIQLLETISASAAAAGVTITLSAQTEAFTITGSANADTITGGTAADTITGGAGVDTLDGGSGAVNDTFNLANGDFASGESITGGAGTGDTIVLTNATTVDFTTGTLATVETLTGSGSADTVTMGATTFGGIFTTINLGGGTDTLNVTTSGTTDISGASATTVTTENGNLTGSSGDDTLTLTGAQLDGMMGGTTGTVVMGGGADTLVLTSTSTRFNTTAGTDGSVTGLEVITVSGSPSITISIAGQTEDFTINGGGGVDTITGGRGDTTIYGNAGADVIVASSIDTLAAQAAVIVAANSGVTYDSTTDSFYKYVNSAVTWATANTAAAATVINGIAGHLVQINNATENTAIDTLGGGNAVWIGVNDTGTEGTYLMVGGPMNGVVIRSGGAAQNGIYANWAVGNPGASAADDDYIRQENGGTWTDQQAATTSRYVIEWEGSELVFATTSTTIIGGAGADTITGGAGKDTFVFDTASSGSVDTINSFSVVQHDALDVSQLLTGYVAGTSDVDDFARLTVSGADLLFQIDANGTTGGASFTTIATLVGLGASGLNVTEMVAKRNLVMNVPAISFYFDWGTGNYTYNSNSIANTTFTNTTIGRAPMDGTNEFSINRTSTQATLDYLNASAPGTLIVTGSTENDRINISGIISALTGTVNLGAGNDTLTITSAGNFTIDGGIGNDNITAGAGADTITGGTGMDTLTGGSGNDTFNLANGDWSSGESITGGANTDTLTLTNASTVDFSTGTLATLETFTGSGGNDTVTMSLLQFAQFSTFNMGAGTNILHVTFSGTVDSSGLVASPTVSNVGTGDFTGSSGVDTVTMTGGQLDGIMNGAGIIDFAGGADVLNLTSTSADLNTLGATNASIVNLETISASTAAAGVTISLTGQTEGFTITGSANNDTITGGSGNDTVQGGLGDDTLNGNGGTGDTVTYANASSGVTVNLTTLVAQNTVGAGTDTLSNFENLTGSAFADTLTGDGNANTITGNGGSDFLYGLGGNDSLYSGSTDTITAAAAAIVAANAGVVYNATTGSFYKYVNSSVTWATANTAAAATVIGGVAGHLVQINNATENTAVDGYGGTRSVWTGLNDATTNGTYQFIGGLMNGVIVRSGGVAQNSIYQNFAGGNPSDSSATDDYIRQRDGGRWYDDTSTTTYRYLIEWEGSRLLTPGNTTTLSGGAGTDTLYGGAGQDIFLFEAATAGTVDTISGYDKTDIDKIDIGDLLTGYTAGVSDVDDFAKFVVSGADLNLQIDANGTTGGVAFTTIATLTGMGTSGLNITEMAAHGLLIMT